MLPTTSSSSSSPTGLNAADSAKRAQPVQVAMAVAKSGLLTVLLSQLHHLLDLWSMDWQQHRQGNMAFKVSTYTKYTDTVCVCHWWCGAAGLARHAGSTLLLSRVTCQVTCVHHVEYVVDASHFHVQCMKL